MTNDFEQQAAQLIGIGIPADTITDEVRSLIHKGVRNIIFFSRNAQNPQQFAALTHEVKNLSKDPILTSIDQEGGRVMRLRDPFTPIPSMRDLGATNDQNLATQIGQVLAAEIRAVNIDIDLAPVLDVDTNPANPVISSRSFSPDADVVTRLGVALLKGIQSQNVAACAKHFPGHGDTSKDSHHELPILPHDLARLDQLELKPFKAAIKANVACIMSAHVIYKPIDERPATLSHKILTDLLRTRLNFKGYVMSDDMQMKAIADHYGYDDAIVQSINAGCDLLWICHSPQLQHRAIEVLAKAIEANQIPRDRIEQSRKRLQQLTQKYYKPSTPNPDLSRIGTEAHRAIAARVPTTSIQALDPTERFIRQQKTT